MQYLAQIKKALAAVAGVAALLIAQGVLSGPAEHWAEVVLAALTALGVYGVTNAKAPESADVA